MSGQITITVTEVEPGWALVHFKGGKPPPTERLASLERALRDWTVSHPGYTLKQQQLVEFEGDIYGLHAWFTISPDKLRAISFDVTPPVLKVHSQEYVEAVMDDIGKFLKLESVPPGRIAVVNRRGVVILVNADRNHGRMILLDQLEPLLDEGAFARLRDWLAEPKTTHYAILMPDR